MFIKFVAHISGGVHAGFPRGGLEEKTRDEFLVLYRELTVNPTGKLSLLGLLKGFTRRILEGLSPLMILIMEEAKEKPPESIEMPRDQKSKGDMKSFVMDLVVHFNLWR